MTGRLCWEPHPPEMFLGPCASPEPGDATDGFLEDVDSASS